MPRLPIPGSDGGQWGDILNEYLSVSHEADGSIKSSAIPPPSDGATGATGIQGPQGTVGAQGATGPTGPPTNLTTSVNSTTVTVTSDTGTDATIPAATTTDAGVLTAADKSTIDGLGNSSGLDVGTVSGTVAAGDDARLSDARTPTAHKASHENGGADEIALDASQVTSGQFSMARLATGTPDGTKFVRDDGTLAAPSGGTPSSTHPRVPSGQYKNTPILFGWDLPTSGFVFWVPMPIERSQAFDAIGLIVQTATAGTVADIALVDDNNGYPGTVQRSSTGLVLTTSVEKLVTGAFSSITLGVGLVWMAVRVDDPSANCRVACAANTSQHAGLLPYTHFSNLPPYPNPGAHTGYGGGYRSATTLASIPATAPSGMTIQRFSPIPGLRAA